MSTLREELISDLRIACGYTREQAERVIDEALCSTPGPGYARPARRRRRGPIHRLLAWWAAR